jgi:hypothetical protein
LGGSAKSAKWLGHHTSRSNPPEVPLHWPPNEPEEPPRDALRDPQNERAKLQEFVFTLYRRFWYEYLTKLRDSVVPEAYRDPGPLGYWTKFLSACLLYDPPDDDLEGFARYADPDPATLATEGNWSDNGEDEDRDVLVLPIKHLPDPYRVRADAEWYFETAIDEMGELLQERLEQAGIKPEQFSIDIWELFREVAYNRLKDNEERYGSLYHEYVGKQLQNESCPYIDPSNEEATEENVRAALRLIRQTQAATAKVGKPKIASLVAVQCAILYYRHNPRDSEDRRRRRWTFKKLAERFGLESERAAKHHVELGQELLEKKNRVQ